MRVLLVEIAVLMVTSGCLVDERCETSADCPSGKVCSQDGRCIWECESAVDCGPGFTCKDHLCTPDETQEMACPADMVKVGNFFCIDQFEASRPDATADLPGTIETVAMSRPGVLPWMLDDDNELADAACAAAGKRLCSSFEWEVACRGPAMTNYGYGNSYDETICNGIDTFGPSGIKLLPTGAFAGCTNGWGAYDMNGNLWEHVAHGDGKSVRGGAYNCIDSMSLHRCDYVPRTWVPSALGFRCCMTPEGAVDRQDIREEPDAGILDVPEVLDAPRCLDPDLGPSPEVEVAVEVEITLPECLHDDQCLHLLDDANQCVEALCLEDSTCALQTAVDGAPCNDDDQCTIEDSCVAGECTGGSNICQCLEDADCLLYEDDSLCNGTLVCDQAVTPFACIVNEQTIVTCKQPLDPCFAAECQPDSGLCVESSSSDGTPCDDGDICNGPDHCLGGVCVAGNQSLCACPKEMVSVNDLFCLDQYEASRPDASAQFMGNDLSMATSQPNVIPWSPVDYAAAYAACAAAGKRLCTEAETTLACSGLDGATYVYGDQYSATTCNGIDAFCNCNSPNCAELELCPYPHCYNESPEGIYGEGCGAYFHVTPTGTFEGCVNEWGAYDINGNVWELVDRGNGESWYKGGAYNCSNSEWLHQCQGLFQNISAKGFRCCLDVQI
jgi:formylglycine-generating enzyme required for sulfatase activity